VGYAVSLEISLDFQDFHEELANLPWSYVPPAGVSSSHCGKGKQLDALHCSRFATGICEMKRLYIRPSFRGLKFGRALAEVVIEKARETGNARVRLDTLPSMERARTLYAELGFREIEPYRYNPIEGATFMGLTLD
jgi:putative acetyltransferase